MREDPWSGLKQREDTGEEKEEMMTLATCNGSDTMLDTFIHSFTVSYLRCIEYLPGTPSVGDIAVIKIASDFKEFIIS